MNTKSKVRLEIRESDFPNRAFYERYMEVARLAIMEFLSPLDTIPEKVYHFTLKRNVKAIKKYGLMEGVDGGIFVSESFEDNLNVLKEKIIGAEVVLDMFGNEKPNTAKLDDYVILEATPVHSELAKWYTFSQEGKGRESLFYKDEMLKLKNITVHYLTPR